MLTARSTRCRMPLSPITARNAGSAPRALLCRFMRDFVGGLDGCAGQIDRLLAGNLCRCTGYGGLVQGGVALAASGGAGVGCGTAKTRGGISQKTMMPPII